MSLYNIDLFISYAHIDNQPLSDDKTGWISRFHASLDTLLSMRLGKSVRIWRDDKLQGNDRFAEEIVDQFKSTAVLVSVLTPRYLNSEWCTREVSEFCENVQNELFVDNKARIFKIVKTPVVSQNTLPEIMQELLGYDFFVCEDGVPMELDDVYGEQYGKDFNRKVSKLAFEIAELLKQLEVSSESGAEPVSTVADQKPVVYLAECTYDMKETRDSIETQLKCLGYSVLPDRTLPGNEEEYIAAVTSLLERCEVSVHLVGEQYGAVPHGPSDKSTADIQNSVAAQISQSSQLSRLIWLKPNALSADPKQQLFIDELQSNACVQHGADLLTGDIETFKTSLVTLLKNIEAQSAQPEAENKPADMFDDKHDLYLVCTEQDRKATVPLRKYLREHGVNVSMPAFKGDAGQVRQINQQLLTSSKTIMVFYGDGEEAWMRSIDTELRKLPAYLEGRPPPPILRYLAGPATCDKEDMIDMEEPGTIDGIHALAEQALDGIFSEALSVLDAT